MAYDGFFFYIDEHVQDPVYQVTVLDWQILLSNMILHKNNELKKQ